MSCRARYALLALVALASLLPARGQTRDLGYAVTNAPNDDALDFVDRLASANFYQAAELLSPDLRRTATPQVLADQWKEITKRLGRFQDREVKSVSPDGTSWHIHVLCTFEKGKLDVVVDYTSLNTDHLVLAYSFVPFTGDAPITY